MSHTPEIPNDVGLAATWMYGQEVLTEPMLAPHRSPVEIITRRSGLILREQATLANDLTFFTNLRANVAHLSTFSIGMVRAYPTLTSVTNTRHLRPDRLPLNLWYNGDFAGNLILTTEEQPKRPRAPKKGRLSYWLASAYTGQGLMTDAVKAVCEHVHDTHNLLRANIDEDNATSANVLERAGFVRHPVVTERELVNRGMRRVHSYYRLW